MKDIMKCSLCQRVILNPEKEMSRKRIMVDEDIIDGFCISCEQELMPVWKRAMIPLRLKLSAIQDYVDRKFNKVVNPKQ